jgi:tetratricopeptide (TPR) repeat protein
MKMTLNKYFVAVLFLFPTIAGLAQEAPQSAFAVLLGEAKNLAQAQRLYDACLLFNKILSEAPETDPTYQEAQFQMGVALFNLKLYVSSFGYLDKVAEAGPSHPRYLDALPFLVRIHRVIPGERATLFRLQSYAYENYPPDMADEISFYVGQYNYYEGNLDKALESLERVSEATPNIYPRAMFLKGAIFVRRDDNQRAVEAFQKAYDYILKNKKNIQNPATLEDMVKLALARASYAMGMAHSSSEAEASEKAKMLEKAITYYDLVSEESNAWLESLFEKAWAYFQLGNYARALGTLHTVSSPYFEEEFYPEAYILKAIIFYKNCYYDEALATIDPFYSEYYAVLKELESALETYKDPDQFYQYLAAISVRGGQHSIKVKKIFNAALADKRLRSMFAFVVHVSKEIQLVEQLKGLGPASELAEILLPDLTAFRSITMAEAGKLARERLVGVQKELRSILSQALRVRFETLNAQKGILAEAEGVEQPVLKGKKEDNVPLDFEHVRWPFDGEYWKDELGSYYYPLPSRCVQK